MTTTKGEVSLHPPRVTLDPGDAEVRECRTSLVGVTTTPTATRWLPVHPHGLFTQASRASGKTDLLVSIRFELNDECPTPFATIVYGEHIKIIKNPRLCVNLPFWLQEDMANDALRGASPMPPKHMRHRAADVIQIETLREMREVRKAADKDRSSSV